MNQCLRVLNKIQPATIKEWRDAYYKDLQDKGFVCFTYDMDWTLTRCKKENYAVKVNKKYSLRVSLSDTLERLEKEILIESNIREKEISERKEEVKQHLKDLTDSEIRSKLEELFNNTHYLDIDGEGWEILEMLL